MARVADRSEEAMALWFASEKSVGITLEEHQLIIAREGNQERRAFYELCWHLAARNRTSQLFKQRMLIGRIASSLIGGGKRKWRLTFASAMPWPKS
jgi:hypothetical protein